MNKKQKTGTIKEILEMESKYALLSSIQKRILRIFLRDKEPKNEFNVRIALYFDLVHPIMVKQALQKAKPTKTLKKSTKFTVSTKQKLFNGISGNAFMGEWDKKLSLLSFQQRENELRTQAKKLNIKLPSNMKIKNNLEQLANEGYLIRQFSKETLGNTKRKRAGLPYALNPEFYEKWEKLKEEAIQFDLKRMEALRDFNLMSRFQLLWSADIEDLEY
jgi:hypothetical protein